MLTPLYLVTHPYSYYPANALTPIVRPRPMHQASLAIIVALT